jgi:hypothetical protein
VPGWDYLLAANDATRELTVAKDVSPWLGSPFEWIMVLPSRSKGAVAEKLAASFFGAAGYPVTKPSNSGHDRVINGHKVEVKMSSLWKGGTYTWQQIRDQDYELCFLLGLAPQNAYAWLMPKEVAVEHSVPQHGGSVGTDTRWLTITAAQVPAWMNDWGGDLDVCLQVAEGLLQ